MRMASSHFSPTSLPTYPPTRLMAAVLRAAVDDCLGSTGQKREFGRPVDPQDARRAFAYVVSTDRAWPFSFENVCEALSVDADSLRAKLLAGAAQAAAEPVAGERERA
jgi:hypothetical protein